MHSSMTPLSQNPAVQIMEAMTAEERTSFGFAYDDLLEVCRHMEIKQGLCRSVIISALLATVVTLYGNTEGFSDVLDVLKRR